MDWDSFQATTDLILQGKWLHIYENHQTFGSFSFTPLPFFLMAPFRFLGQALALPQGAQDVLAAVPMLAGDLLSAWALVRLVRGFRPTTKQEDIFLFTVYLTAWVVFFDSAYHSHFESILLWFLLLALEKLRKGQPIGFGVFLALALLTKQTAVVVAIPCFLVLLFDGRRADFWRALGTLGGIALAFMAPFLIADFTDVKHVLVDMPNQLPVAYQSVWWIFAGNVGVMAFLDGAGPFLNGLTLVLAGVYSGMMIWRYRINTKDPRLIGISAACAVIMVFLERWGSLHYFLIPFALLLAWETSTQGRPWASVLFTAILSNLFFLKYSVETHFGFNQVTGWIMIFLFAGTLVYLTYQLRSSNKG